MFQMSVGVNAKYQGLTFASVQTYKSFPFIFIIILVEDYILKEIKVMNIPKFIFSWLDGKRMVWFAQNDTL